MIRVVIYLIIGVVVVFTYEQTSYDVYQGYPYKFFVFILLVACYFIGDSLSRKTERRQ